MLIILTGLPGTGKTSVSKIVSERIGALFLCIDSIECGLKNSVLQIDPAEDAGYTAAYGIAEDNLQIGHSVIADSVNPITVTRQAWLDVADQAGVRAIEVEFKCSDLSEHQRRVEVRISKSDRRGLPTWQSVCERVYDLPNSPAITIDTARKSVEECAEELMSKLRAV